MDDEGWIFDSLVGFLRGPVWNVPILTFIEHKSLVFEPGEDEKNETEYTRIHEEYKNLVDFMLGSYMEDIGISVDQFDEACGTGKKKIKSQFQQALFEQVWAADDFEIFKRMMIQKNIELQLQALELLQQRYGVLPESLRPEVKKDEHEMEVMEQISQKSKDEHEAHVAALTSEDAEIEMALANSVEEHRRLEAERQNQEALMVEHFKKVNITDATIRVVRSAQRRDYRANLGINDATEENVRIFTDGVQGVTSGAQFNKESKDYSDEDYQKYVNTLGKVTECKQDESGHILEEKTLAGSISLIGNKSRLEEEAKGSSVAAVLPTVNLGEADQSGGRDLDGEEAEVLLFVEVDSLDPVDNVPHVDTKPYADTSVDSREKSGNISLPLGISQPVALEDNQLSKLGNNQSLILEVVQPVKLESEQPVKREEKVCQPVSRESTAAESLHSVEKVTEKHDQAVISPLNIPLLKQVTQHKTARETSDSLFPDSRMSYKG